MKKNRSFVKHEKNVTPSPSSTFPLQQKQSLPLKLNWSWTNLIVDGLLDKIDLK